MPQDLCVANNWVYSDHSSLCGLFFPSQTTEASDGQKSKLQIHKKTKCALNFTVKEMWENNIHSQNTLFLFIKNSFFFSGNVVTLMSLTYSTRRHKMFHTSLLSRTLFINCCSDLDQHGVGQKHLLVQPHEPWLWFADITGEMTGCTVASENRFFFFFQTKRTSPEPWERLGVDVKSERRRLS